MTQNRRLKDVGLRVTSQRLKILELMEKSQERHLSAEMIYRELNQGGEEMALATVYRVLTQFETSGLVIRHYFHTGESLFELADMEHHDHLVCIYCGLVDEFTNDVIEAEQEAIARANNFLISDHSLTIYGICSACQDKGHYL